MTPPTTGWPNQRAYDHSKLFLYHRTPEMVSLCFISTRKTGHLPVTGPYEIPHSHAAN
jgi:hypothetical protein